MKSSAAAASIITRPHATAATSTSHPPISLVATAPRGSLPGIAAAIAVIVVVILFHIVLLTHRAHPQ
jgi:ABC-type sugar transport system permease subunit